MSPKMPAKVFLRFFIVSSFSRGCPSGPRAGGPVWPLLPSPLASLLTVELAELTPLTVLDSEARKGKYIYMVMLD